MTYTAIATPPKYTTLPTATASYSTKDDPTLMQINSTYQKRAGELQQAYDSASAKASIDALSRGMARSSYAHDAQVNLQSGFLSAQQDLFGQQAQETAQYLTDLRDKREQQDRDAIKYNNELLNTAWKADLDYAKLISQQESDKLADATKRQQEAAAAWKLLNQPAKGSAGQNKKTTDVPEQPVLSAQEIYSTIKKLGNMDTATVASWNKYQGYDNLDPAQQAGSMLAYDEYIERIYADLYRQQYGA